jgi:uncharacterized protein
MPALSSTPFDPERLLGAVSRVTGDTVLVNVAGAALPASRRYGVRIGAGEVGEFVVIECDHLGVLARITEVRVPEGERWSVEPRVGPASTAHPVAVAQLLSTIDLVTRKHEVGLVRYPRIGARAYAAHPALLGWIIEGDLATDQPTIELGAIAGYAETSIRLTPSRLFGRHCAIVGTTGSGKSWTAARILEEACAQNAKVLLIDATGEYHTLADNAHHLSIGTEIDQPAGTGDVVLPHHVLDERDLFALFRPAPGVQAPKLRSAIESLRLARILGADHGLVTGGCIEKTNKDMASFFEALREHESAVTATTSSFDVAKLPKQIRHECIWLSSRDDPRQFGRQHDTDLSHCQSLIIRIHHYLTAPDFAAVFQPAARLSVTDALASFLSDSSHRILRLSLRHQPFGSGAREVIVNAIGRHLLQLGREGKFHDVPLLVVLDEAHQFLGQTAGDEFSGYPLDAFELIAKEGRKYGLALVLATQRPRDLSVGVISQVGTILAHRLINQHDRELVEAAGSDTSKSMMSRLSTLAPGEAVIVGVDFAVPVTVQVARPARPPDSRGPDFEVAWAVATS